MRFWQVFETQVVKEDGKIVPNVNTTKDVQPGEITRQAAKFGNKLKADGTPPTFTDQGNFTNAKDTVDSSKAAYGKDGTRKS